MDLQRSVVMIQSNEVAIDCTRNREGCVAVDHLLQIVGRYRFAPLAQLDRASVYGSNAADTVHSTKTRKIACFQGYFSLLPLRLVHCTKG